MQFKLSEYTSALINEKADEIYLSNFGDPESKETITIKGLNRLRELIDNR